MVASDARAPAYASANSLATAPSPCGSSLTRLQLARSTFRASSIFGDAHLATIGVGRVGRRLDHWPKPPAPIGAAANRSMSPSHSIGVGRVGRRLPHWPKPPASFDAAANRSTSCLFRSALVASVAYSTIGRGRRLCSTPPPIARSCFALRPGSRLLAPRSGRRLLENRCDLRRLRPIEDARGLATRRRLPPVGWGSRPPPPSGELELVARLLLTSRRRCRCRRT